MPKNRRNLTRGVTDGTKGASGSGGQPGAELGLFSGVDPAGGGGTGGQVGGGSRSLGQPVHVSEVIRGGEWWRAEEREQRLAELRESMRLLSTDEAIYQRVGRALYLFAEYTALRQCGATAAQLETASAAMAQAWSDTSTTAWGIAMQERRRARGGRD